MYLTYIKNSPLFRSYFTLMEINDTPKDQPAVSDLDFRST
jgi:hypothetical protein